LKDLKKVITFCAEMSKYIEDGKVPDAFKIALFTQRT